MTLAAGRNSRWFPFVGEEAELINRQESIDLDHEYIEEEPSIEEGR